jgi:hypothetical protein
MKQVLITATAVLRYAVYLAPGKILRLLKFIFYPYIFFIHSVASKVVLNRLRNNN